MEIDRLEVTVCVSVFGYIHGEFSDILSRQVTDEVNLVKEPYRSWSLATLRQTKFVTLFRHWDVEVMEDETVCPESAHLGHRCLP